MTLDNINESAEAFFHTHVTMWMSASVWYTYNPSYYAMRFSLYFYKSLCHVTTQVSLWNVVVAGNNSDTISIVQLDQSHLNEVTTKSLIINLLEN